MAASRSTVSMIPWVPWVPWACVFLALGGCAGVGAKPSTGSGGQGGSVGMGGATGGGSGGHNRVDAGRAPDATCDGAPGACLVTLCGNGVLNSAGRDLRRRQPERRRRLLARLPHRDRLDLPHAWQPCIYTVECGDGVVSGAETCDDRNTTPGDGCDADCQLESGWTCPRRARVPSALRRRHAAGRRAVRRRQHRGGRRLQRHLSHRTRLRLPDARPGLPPHGLRRRRQGGRGVLRRRQHLSAGTAAARTAGPSRSAPAPAAAPRRAGTASSCPARNATTATSPRATAARRTASSSPAGTATTWATPTTAAWPCRSSTATS